MGPRKRIEARVPSVNLATFTKPAPGGAVEVAGTVSTVDLSERGVKLASRTKLRRGDVLDLEFVLGGEVVKVGARVAHVEEARQYEVGLEFRDLRPGDKEKIRRYVAEHGIRV